jgi:hypothetical protein
VDTVTIDRPTTVQPVPRESTLARVRYHLSTWGQKIKAAAKKVGGWFKRTAKALWNSKAVQWVVAKANVAKDWLWGVAKGPVGWVAAPVAAIVFAPKFVAIAAVVGLIGIAWIGHMLWKNLKRDHPEALKSSVEQTKDDVTEIKDRLTGGPVLEADKIPLDPDETLDERYAYLDKQLGWAKDNEDPGLFTEMTGRRFFIEVRLGKSTTKLKPAASAGQIYNECRKIFEKEMPDFEWAWARCSNAIKNEDKRLKEVARLKAERGKLTSV